ncbi:MAG: zinc metalloprotease HtpX [Chloroflexota bacterium]
MESTLRTTILLAALTGLILAIGGLLGGREGMVMALGMAAAMNFGSYWFSDQIVLRSYGAQPVTAEQAPELLALVSDLAEKAGLPKTPSVYVLPDDGMNAFATGRNPNHAAVAVTRGLLQRLDRRELAGVLAHELGHVRNRDILTGAIAATLAGGVMMLANMLRWGALFGGGRSDDGEGGGPFELLAMVILAPIAATIIQMAISRGREYEADATAARITGDPLALASALSRLESMARRLPMNAGEASSHLFIVNPLQGVSLSRLFSTHPPTEERIARLRAMASASA